VVSRRAALLWRMRGTGQRRLKLDAGPRRAFPSDVITYRQATRAELDVAVERAVAEGWNPGLADADAYWATDPGGFVCAESNGEVIATGSIVSYGGVLGFMGFFIVRPDLRGQGIGREFWRWRCSSPRRTVLGCGSAVLRYGRPTDRRDGRFYRGRDRVAREFYKSKPIGMRLLTLRSPRRMAFAPRSSSDVFVELENRVKPQERIG
jgi:GNAT superfamily N-acetyltransferase